jgi:hypothetical protein
MLQSTGKEASSCDGTPPYKRHRPERTLLYQLVQKHYPVFEAHCAEQGKPLPTYVCQAPVLLNRANKGQARARQSLYKCDDR